MPRNRNAAMIYDTEFLCDLEKLPEGSGTISGYVEACKKGRGGSSSSSDDEPPPQPQERFLMPSDSEEDDGVSAGPPKPTKAKKFTKDTSKEVKAAKPHCNDKETKSDEVPSNVTKNSNQRLLAVGSVDDGGRPKSTKEPAADPKHVRTTLHKKPDASTKDKKVKKEKEDQKSKISNPQKSLARLMAEAVSRAGSGRDKKGGAGGDNEEWAPSPRARGPGFELLLDQQLDDEDSSTSPSPHTSPRRAAAAAADDGVDTAAATCSAASSFSSAFSSASDTPAVVDFATDGGNVDNCKCRGSEEKPLAPLAGEAARSLRRAARSLLRFRGVVVARVLACETHPRSSALALVHLSLGKGGVKAAFKDTKSGDVKKKEKKGEALTAVCEAGHALAAGDKVALALVGAEVVDEVLEGALRTVSPLRVKGQPSAGLLCRPSHLGLPATAWLGSTDPGYNCDATFAPAMVELTPLLDAPPAAAATPSSTNAGPGPSQALDFSAKAQPLLRLPQWYPTGADLAEAFLRLARPDLLAHASAAAAAASSSAAATNVAVKATSHAAEAKVVSASSEEDAVVPAASSSVADKSRTSAAGGSSAAGAAARALLRAREEERARRDAAAAAAAAAAEEAAARLAAEEAAAELAAEARRAARRARAEEARRRGEPATARERERRRRDEAAAAALLAQGLVRPPSASGSTTSASTADEARRSIPVHKPMAAPLPAPAVDAPPTAGPRSPPSCFVAAPPPSIKTTLSGAEGSRAVVSALPAAGPAMRTPPAHDAGAVTSFPDPLSPLDYSAAGAAWASLPSPPPAGACGGATLPPCSSLPPPAAGVWSQEMAAATAAGGDVARRGMGMKEMRRVEAERRARARAQREEAERRAAAAGAVG